MQQWSAEAKLMDLPYSARVPGFVAHFVALDAPSAHSGHTPIISITLNSPPKIHFVNSSLSFNPIEGAFTASECA